MPTMPKGRCKLGHSPAKSLFRTAATYKAWSRSIAAILISHPKKCPTHDALPTSSPWDRHPHCSILGSVAKDFVCGTLSLFWPAAACKHSLVGLVHVLTGQLLPEAGPTYRQVAIGSEGPGISGLKRLSLEMLPTFCLLPPRTSCRQA